MVATDEPANKAHRPVRVFPDFGTPEGDLVHGCYATSEFNTSVFMNAVSRFTSAALRSCGRWSRAILPSRSGNGNSTIPVEESGLLDKTAPLPLLLLTPPIVLGLAAR